MLILKTSNAMRVWRFLFSITQILRSKWEIVLHQDSPRFSNAIVDEYLKKSLLRPFGIYFY
jgi:hypothetical protein